MSTSGSPWRVLERASPPAGHDRDGGRSRAAGPRLRLPRAVTGACHDDRVAPRPPHRRHLRHAQREPLEGDPVTYQTARWSGDAASALAALDDGYDRWIAGVSRLTPEVLSRPVGPSEGAFAEHSYASLVLHITREVIHHGAEVLLLRDLYGRLGTNAGR